MGTGIVSRHGNIDRIIQCERCVNDAAIKVSISAVAGMVSTACDQIGVNPVVVGRVASPDNRVVGPATGMLTGSKPATGACTRAPEKWPLPPLPALLSPVAITSEPISPNTPTPPPIAAFQSPPSPPVPAVWAAD